MAYTNPYLNYQPYQTQMYPAQPQQASFIAPASNGINWVSGESGAKAWIVGRGETAILMDSENQCFYIKSADASGMPMPLRVFDYTERTSNSAQASNSALIQSNDNFITRKEFDELKAKYEAIEKKVNPKKKEAVDYE